MTQNNSDLNRRFTHGSIFSGIGGFDLAAEWMGWENVFHCEWNEFGQRVLKYYWPKAISYGDITKTEFSVHRGRIDILSGGFPCQPYSVAGKRKGKEDERHLWPEMLRAIREIEPRWVVGENVPGLINWNGGMVFDEVQDDLEAQGYEVIPFVLPACGVGAPHRRDRVWFVAFNPKFKSNGRHNRRKSKGNGVEVDGNLLDQAGRNESSNNAESSGVDASYSTSDRRDWKGEEFTDENGESQQGQSGKLEGGLEGLCPHRNVTNSENIRQEQSGRSRNRWPRFTDYNINDASNANGQLYKGGSGKERRKKAVGHFSASFCKNTWENFPTQSPICGGDDGLPSRLDGITFPKWRNESIKGFGNAVVPQVVYQIFKAIEQFETLTQ